MDASHRILVVCDEAVMLERLGKYLGEQGFDVQCAGSDAEAIAISREWTPELVISDSRLAGASALEMADAIHQLHPRVRFILITPPGETPEFVHIASNRIIAFLGKPFNPEDLMHFVSSAFNTADSQCNRREHSRHSFMVETHLTLINPFDDSESRTIVSLMRDVSRSGLTMIVRQLLPVPAMLKISFNVGGQQSNFPMLAKSMSCTLTQIPGVYRLGAKFIGLLPRDLERSFIKMNNETTRGSKRDIYMGTSFKEAAMEWLALHRDTFAPETAGVSQRMIDEMAHDFFKSYGDEDTGGH